MKLGANEGIFKCFGDNRYKMMKKYGFDYADYVLDGVLGDKTEEEYEAMVLAEKALADEAGVTIHQIHGHWRWLPHDETEALREERAEWMRRSIRLGAKIGCKNWVIHPMMPFGPSSDDFMLDEFMRINFEFFRNLLPYAKEHDVTICFENMPMTRFSLATPQRILEFVRQMNDDHFKICLDTGHVSVFPELSLPDETRALGDEIRVLHVHDNNFGRDAHMFPYFGIIDWKPFGKALKDIGFNGSFSIETRPPEQLPDHIYEKFAIALRETAEWIVE